MTESSLKKARILIVDDSVANIALLTSILGRIGYDTIKSLTDSREVLAQMSEFHPDLVILDLMMPHLDGFQVMEQLQGVIPAEAYLPILVLTADVTTITKRKALASGATDLLHKPFDASEIFMRIRNLLLTRFLHLETQNQNQILEQKVRERTGELAMAMEELKETQGRIVQQERLRAFGEMAGGVVHDFNNALMSVIGYSDLLLQDPTLLDDRPMVIDYLKTMNTAGRDASHVVSRLRDFYRPREDADVFVALDLNGIIEEAVALTQPKWKDQALAGGRTIAIDLDLAKIPPVAGNASELREALTNLIFNAVDAMPEGGTLTLRTQREDERVIIALSDTGTGMNEETRTRCLEPFFSTKAEQGTGLGLSMVFGIIQRHDGKLAIESELGRGTTFRISFPSQVELFQADPDSALRPARTLRILVVDDETVARDVVTKYLQADGHEVVNALTGADAMERFQAEEFDLLVTDQGMPGMSGVQLARAIRQIKALQPVILLTGSKGLALACSDVPTDVDLVLDKPIPHKELRKAVSHLFPA